MFLVFHEQITNGQDPQTINQSKQHKLNQKWRPKSANKQLISQNRNRSLPKIKTQIRKSTQVRSVAGVWGEKSDYNSFFFFFLIKKAVEENSLSWVFNWVLGFGKKQLESDYWKVKNTLEKSSVCLEQFRWVIFVLFLTQNSQYCTFVEK